MISAMTPQAPTVHQLICDIHAVAFFQSTERDGTATRSELRRWCDNGAVVINGNRMKAMDAKPEQILSMVLFPKSKRRTTLR